MVTLSKCKKESVQEEKIYYYFKETKTINFLDEYSLVKKEIPIDKKFIKSLKNTILDFRNIYAPSKYKIPFSKMYVISQSLFSLSQVDLKFMEIYFAFSLDDIPDSCASEECKNGEIMNHAPIYFYKKGNDKWKLFAHPVVGQCTGYNDSFKMKNEKTKLNELIFTKKFNKINSFKVYDNDFDGKFDTFSIIPREHYPQTYQFYYFKDGKIFVGNEICFGEKAELCRSPAGC